MTGQTHYYKINIISPTHIGMGQDRDLVNGIDYIIQKNELLQLDKKSLLSQIKNAKLHSAYSTELLKGRESNMLGFFERNKLLNDEVIQKRIKLDLQNASIENIKIFFQNGLGFKVIPGSSIKGALRSIIGYQILKDQNKKVYDEKSIFGSIDNNLMRLIQVSDCFIQETTVMPVKVYSADKGTEGNEGKWKDINKGGHNRRFDPKKFVVYYEVGTKNQESFLKLNYPNTLKEAIKPVNADFFSKHDLFSLLQKQAQDFIKKELDYFDAFPNDDLGDIQVFYENLLEMNQGNKALLRIGSNVGYHSITGDWEFAHHMVDDPKDKNVLKAKTRKLSFNSNKQQQFTFEPLGWICLEKTDQSSYEKAISIFLNSENKLAANPTIEIISEPAKRNSYVGKLKDGVLIDAVVTKFNSPMVYFEIDLEGQMQEVSLKYNAGIEVGKLVILRVNSFNKKTNKIESVSYVKEK